MVDAHLFDVIAILLVHYGINQSTNLLNLNFYFIAMLKPTLWLHGISNT